MSHGFLVSLFLYLGHSSEGHCSSHHSITSKCQGRGGGILGEDQGMDQARHSMPLGVGLTYPFRTTGFTPGADLCRPIRSQAAAE